MDSFKRFHEDLFSIRPDAFEAHALDLFRYQATHNPIYAQYVSLLGVDIATVTQLCHIPFLPIDFFKSHKVTTHEWEPATVFESSGTTGQIRSRHYVKDVDFYLRVTEHIFNSFYGKLEDFHVMALLPSYLERENSSLVAMADYFIRKSQSPFSGFYLYDHNGLVEQLKHAINKGGRVILLGVSFALLDLAERFNVDLADVIVMETGGMKGRREELTRGELHTILKRRFNVVAIHSEYGMTELLSQAYSKADGHFETPPWMKILIRDINDPFEIYGEGAKNSGGVNIIDLANVQSCAFIETQDIGRRLNGDSFEILGRFDNADVRGCNLMAI